MSTYALHCAHPLQCSPKGTATSPWAIGKARRRLLNVCNPAAKTSRSTWSASNCGIHKGDFNNASANVVLASPPQFANNGSKAVLRPCSSYYVRLFANRSHALHAAGDELPEPSVSPNINRSQPSVFFEKTDGASRMANAFGPKPIALLHDASSRKSARLFSREPNPPATYHASNSILPSNNTMTNTSLQKPCANIAK